MKWSMYNHLVESPGSGTFFIYNSITNDLFELEKDEYELFRHIGDGFSPVSELDAETYNNLLHSKMLVEDNGIEFLKYKLLLQGRRFDRDTVSLVVTPVRTHERGVANPSGTEGEDAVMDRQTAHALVNFISLHGTSKRVNLTWNAVDSRHVYNTIRSVTEQVAALGSPYMCDIVADAASFDAAMVEDFDRLHVVQLHLTVDTRCGTVRPGSNWWETDPYYSAVIHNIDIIISSENFHLSLRINMAPEAIETGREVYATIRERYREKEFSLYASFSDKPSACNHVTAGHAGSRHSKFLLDIYDSYQITGDPNLLPRRIDYECLARSVYGYFVDVDGFLYKCWLDCGKPGEAIGHIYRPDHSDNMRYIEYLTAADHLEDPECRSCGVLPICGGGCPRSRIKSARSGRGKVCHMARTNLGAILEAHNKNLNSK